MKKIITSGLHKGKIGKVVREVQSAYEIKAGSGEPIIVHKSRCEDYQVGMEAAYLKEASKKVIPLFG